MILAEPSEDGGMGGTGAGGYYRLGKRDILEDYTHIDVNRWHRGGLLRQAQRFTCRWSYSDGRAASSIGVESSPEGVKLAYRLGSGTATEQDVEYRVPLTWTACHYGGWRPWFVCPGRDCGRRVTKLYLVGRYFLCRHCHDLTYASTREGPEFQLLRRASRIRMRLSHGRGGAGSVLVKPKGMRWRTYLRLLQQANEAERAGTEAMGRRFDALARGFERLLSRRAE